MSPATKLKENASEQEAAKSSRLIDLLDLRSKAMSQRSQQLERAANQPDPTPSVPEGKGEQKK